MKTGYGLRDTNVGCRVSSVGMLRGIATGILLMAVYTSAQEPGMEMSGFRVPEYDKQGNMTAQLFGRHAEVRSPEKVKIDQLRLEFYQTGTTFVTIESPFCFYNPKTREAASEATVSAIADKIEMTGRGFEWKPALQSIQIFNDVHVVMENSGELTNPVFSSGNAVTGGVVTITSKELLLDYAAKVAHFEKDVCVKNGTTEMHCEQLAVPLSEGDGARVLNLPGMTKSVVE